MTKVGDQRITLEQARALVKKYQAEMQADDKKSFFFGRDILRAILDQPGDCQGIRFFFAKKDDGAPSIVIAGEDADSNILVGVLGDLPPFCPPFCCVTNPIEE